MINISKKNKDFDDLYRYVKDEILGYGNDKKMPKYMVLRLLGLKDGKFMTNKKQVSHANYDFKIILTTFKLCKTKINDYIMRNNTKFKDERHKFNGIMLIVESEINNIVDRIDKAKKSEEKTTSLQLDHQVNNQTEYKKRNTKRDNKNLSNLW